MSRSKIVILMGFGSILLLVTLLIVIGFTNLNKSKTHLDQIVNSNNLKLQLANQIRSSARERTISLQNMMIIEDLIDHNELMSRMAEYGGNQFEYFNTQMNQRSKQRLTLEHDLHEALANNQLQIYYQPQNAINGSRKIVGTEANGTYLRWFMYFSVTERREMLSLRGQSAILWKDQ